MAPSPRRAIRGDRFRCASSAHAATRVGICRSLGFLGAILAQDPASLRQGQAALLRALAIAEELDDAWGRGFVRALLGWSEIDLGNHELAAAYLRDAARVAGIGPIRGTAIEGLAKVWLESDPRRAARLVGACASVRESGGGVPPGWLKRRGQAVRADAERVLGPAEARQAWEEGRRMSTAEAVAYASGEA